MDILYTGNPIGFQENFLSSGSHLYGFYNECKHGPSPLVSFCVINLLLALQNVLFSNILMV